MQFLVSRQLKYSKTSPYLLTTSKNILLSHELKSLSFMKVKEISFHNSRQNLAEVFPDLYRKS